jgi:glycosyltransferase involved in cell wall biosynthesis
MRVAMLAPPWFPVPPARYGGIERVVALLTDRLYGLGVDITLFCAPGSHSPAPMVHTLPHAYDKKVHDSMLELDHVLQVLRYTGRGYDLVHDHTNIGLALADAAWPRDIPMVHTMHNGHAKERGQFYLRHGGAAHLVAISEAQWKTAPSGLRVAATIPNPIDPEEWPFNDNKAGYVLWVGNFNEAKGAHRAILACQMANKRLVLAGPVQAGQESYFKTEVAPFVDGRWVKYVGEIGGARKKWLFSNAAAFLMPITWNEPFGMVMIEALVCGTPVIAFPYGAATEIVIDGKNGYQVADAAAMAEALSEVGTIDSYACRESVLDRYNPLQVAEDYAALYERVIG